MADVTEADREKAARVLFDVEMWAHVTGQRNVIAAALAEEREKARAPFLALASELDVFVANRGLPAEGSYDAGLNRAQSNAAYAIRRAAEVTE